MGTPVRLTDSAVFLKAGEAYFSGDGERLVFQAIEHPPVGHEPDSHYAMYVGRVDYDGRGGIEGLSNVTRISAEGSANTCGWFHPEDSRRVLFSTTGGEPDESPKPGYQRESGSYLWAFPPRMNVVTRRLNESGRWGAVEPLIEDDEAYLAEASWSPDGRHVLYTSLATGDGDIYVMDLETEVSHLLVGAAGYDGGAFFSPKGDRICYRSDRRGDDYLQVFIADLEVDPAGAIVGVSQEHTITDDAFVNWCPFWTPGGRSLVFATSEHGHDNYEIVEITTDSTPIHRRRVTASPGFDGLPAFHPRGQWMVWTSQRGDDGTSQVWAAPFIRRASGGTGG